MKRHLISNQVSPNFTFAQSLNFCSKLLNLNKKIDHNFSVFFGSDNYRLLNTARTGLGMLSDLLQVKNVGIPAFTCAVTATPFLHRGANITWIDTDENGVIDITELKKVLSKIDLLLVPHIFGQKAPMKGIYELARKCGVFVIEDRAHFFDPYEIDKWYCDVRLYSFGREKDVSCVSGGALVWKKDCRIHSELSSYELPSPSFIWILRHAFQPFILSSCLSVWFFGGRIVAALCARLQILPKAVTSKERKGKEDFPMAIMPEVMKIHLWEELKGRKKELSHRKKIAQKWHEILKKLLPDAEIILPENYFRVIVKTEKASDIKVKARKIGFDLRDWDGNPIAPMSASLKALKYEQKSCSNAEYFSSNYITFPTNRRTSLKDVERFSTLM